MNDEQQISRWTIETRTCSHAPEQEHPSPSAMAGNVLLLSLQQAGVAALPIEY
jgi:hypothetical protein